MRHQWRWLGLIRIVYVFAALALALPAAQSAPTWTGGTGDWSIAANWDPVGVPGAGADVVITNGSVLLTNNTAALSSLTITNTVLTFSNWMTKVTATNVIIQSGATITHVTNSATTTNADGSWPTNGRVWIVCTNLDLQTGGQINTKARGYCGAPSGGGNGYGPGRGTNSLADYGSGGGYGGSGGMGKKGGVYPVGGPTYGPTNAPEMPGSGGGGAYGGAGGGAVRIDVSGAVTLNGVISADGTNNAGTSTGAGGSGGSILITCRTFTGTTNGILTAKGGRGNYTSNGSGAGGGGRIAVFCDTDAQSGQPKPDVRFNIAGGDVGFAKGVNGTVYLPDPALLGPELSNFEVVRLYGVTNWSVASLSLTNRSVAITNLFIFSERRFALTVTNTLLIDRATLQVGDSNTGIEYMQIDCGDLQLQGTNQSRFYVCSGPTNAITMNYGARVTVAREIVTASNCWIYPVSDDTNGGSVYFTANNVTINAGGGFDANGLGYRAGEGSSINGYGPGGGQAKTLAAGGGGYGGKGGQGWQSGGGNGGTNYPWTNAPIKPGSGGAGGGGYGGAGGGLVWINASGTIVLDGAIQANGINGGGVNGTGGSGSGGGICIVAKAFRGAAGGQLSAYGGSGYFANVNIYSGGGGGGRVAVWYHISQTDQQAILADPDNAQANVPRIVITNDLAMSGFLGSSTASNGWGYGTVVAETGTVVCLTVLPRPGTIFSVH